MAVRAFGRAFSDAPLSGMGFKGGEVAQPAHAVGPSGDEVRPVRCCSQHRYQTASFVARREAESHRQLVHTLNVGVSRLELLVPARARLVRWQARRLFKVLLQNVTPLPVRTVARRWARYLPMWSVLWCASLACSLVTKSGSEEGNALSVNPLAPDLSKPKLVPPPRKRTDVPWTYVLPVDHGVRADDSGQGHFRAPRFHGEHNGLDLLAPVGTPVFSPCEGMAMTGASQSFGRWIHVICPLPEEYIKKGAAVPWASFFYAHLNETSLPFNKWVEVTGAQALGEVGKTGNARGPNIQPHLHLELIVQSNRRAAMDERHLGSDQSSVPAAELFVDRLSERCMAPLGFQSKSQMLRRARRVDPFIALTCLSEFKPNFIKAPSPLTEWSRAWNQYYVAKDFNVNLGVEDSALVAR